MQGVSNKHCLLSFFHSVHFPGNRGIHLYLFLALAMLDDHVVLYDQNNVKFHFLFQYTVINDPCSLIFIISFLMATYIYTCSSVSHVGRHLLSHTVHYRNHIKSSTESIDTSTGRGKHLKPLYQNYFCFSKRHLKSMMNELVHSKTTKWHELLLRLRSAYASAHSNQSQEAYGTWLVLRRLIRLQGV